MAADAIHHRWKKPGEVEFAGEKEDGERGVVDCRDGAFGISLLPVSKSCGVSGKEMLHCSNTEILDVVFRAESEDSGDNGEVRGRWGWLKITGGRMRQGGFSWTKKEYLESRIACRKYVMSSAESYTSTIGHSSILALPSAGGGNANMSLNTEDLADRIPL